MTDPLKAFELRENDMNIKLRSNVNMQLMMVKPKVNIIRLKSTIPQVFRVSLQLTNDSRIFPGAARHDKRKI